MKIIQKAGCESKCVQIGFTRRAVGKQRKTWGKKKKHPLELYRVMQSVTIDQSVGGQGRSRHNTGSRRGRKIPSERTKTVRSRREKLEEKHGAKNRDEMCG